MKIRFFVLTALALTNLQGIAWALDLRLDAGDNELFISKTAIQFIQKVNGKLRIGTLVGNFEITPIAAQPGVDGLEALNSAIDELLELEEPPAPGELLKEFNDLKAAGPNSFSEYHMFRLTLFRGNSNTVQCGAIEQL